MTPVNLTCMIPPRPLRLCTLITLPNARMGAFLSMSNSTMTSLPFSKGERVWIAQPPADRSTTVPSVRRLCSTDALRSGLRAEPDSTMRMG